MKYTFTSDYKRCVLIANAAHNNSDVSVSVSISCVYNLIKNKSFTSYSSPTKLQVYELTDVKQGDTVQISYNPALYYIIFTI